MLFITQDGDINIDLSLQALYFYANWMPLHKKFMTMSEKIEEEYNIPLFAIDVDSFSNWCKRFSIMSIPTILILKSGYEIKKINGFVSTTELMSIFADIYMNVMEKNMTKQANTTAEHMQMTPMTTQVKPESEKIWEEIRTLPISMFGLPNQLVAMHCTPVNVEPSSLYLTIRSQAVLPSLETAIGDQYVIEVVEGYVVVKHAVKLPFAQPFTSTK